MVSLDVAVASLTKRQLGLDALARGLFAVWQIYAVTQRASAIVLAFTVFEIGFGALQLARVFSGAK